MRTLALLSLAALSITSAFAQTGALDKDRGAKSDAIIIKVDQVNLMNHLMPLLMTKEQVRKILPAVEKARQKVRDIEKVEFEDLRKVEAKLDAAIKDGYDKGSVPDPSLLKEVGGIFAAMRTRRDLIAEENAQNVLKVVKETLNTGQFKTAANSLNVRAFNPALKPEEMDDDNKVRIFCREIFLHPLAYDIMVKMSMGN
ncbi:MAG TPA: hypothetical protein PKA27_00060 [Fimbriimonadaceae bacterium]|nr:hypothetical protein [Fimbriimonadaceae bacterium]